MNKFVFAFLLLGLVFLFAQFVITRNSDSVEKNNYVLVKSFPEFEIRKYPSMIVAKSVIPSNTYENSSSKGFRKLAGYIFGGNEENTQIAMTSPVIMDMSDSITMSFIMPNNINASNAPNPKDSSVIIETRASEIVAVIQFGGWASDEKIEQKTKELQALLKEKKIEYYGSPIYMGYNPPYQIINRKNEIALRIKDKK